jgi:hypothetical protein
MSVKASGTGGGTETTPAATKTTVPDPTQSTQMPGMTHEPGMPGMSGTPAPGSWVPVDQDAWQAQLAAFKATEPRPVPAGSRRNPEFNATCTYSHSAKDDPIVFPGQVGKSHLHSFFGNDATDANTTTEKLMKFTASSCKPAEDHSAYWAPSLLEGDKPVEPKEVVVYYGSLLDDPSKTLPMPQGMRMIAGDASLQKPTPAGAPNQFYCAGGPADGKSRSQDGNWPVCEEGATLHFTMRFPDCWDGKHLDSPNHKSHLSFGNAGKCPSTHPEPIPAVTFVITYPTSGTPAGFRLASGLPSSMHGDGFFAWEEDAMAHRVKDCVVQATPCNTAGKF